MIFTFNSISNLSGKYASSFYSKYGPYDYSYSSRLGDSVRHPVAQKKHQMFGKRFFQDQSSVPNSPQLPGVPLVPQQPDIPIKYEYEPYAMHHPSMTHNVDGSIGTVNKHHAQQHQLSQQADVKFSCSLDFARQNRGMHDIVSHNHTYTMPQSTGATPRPQARDKKLAKKIEDEHLTRDEKRARALNVCIIAITHRLISLALLANESKPNLHLFSSLLNRFQCQ